MKFEKVIDTAVGAIYAAIAIHEGYKLYKHVQDLKARDAADTWEREAAARLNAMMSHARKNRISKDGYIQALEAAKNVLSFEVDDVLPDNVHGGKALRNLLSIIDEEIANIQ